ncbi:MAG: insulinase family protein [Alphaproteobacteria bacterium]|nr:insulinase family protein [Alphaproteobacteria bacterium]
MRIRVLFAVAAAMLLSSCASSSSERTDEAQTGLRIPALAYTSRVLDNGLQVYAMPDPNTANVSVQVWYNVGSKDDPEGRSGFAHLFEHIMFKATRNLRAEQFDRLTEDVGGFNNASTWDDFTNYYEVVPANHLQRILFAEADRMGALVVDAETFNSERDVVKEELRQRVLAQPYGRLFYLYLPQTGYDVHPYGRPGIGSIEDLDAATIEDVRAFHAAYYRPDNAVLVVSGNFDPAQLNAWVDQYFAPIARPARQIPRVTAQEPVRRSARDFTVRAPNVPLPAVVMTFPAPPARSSDTAALIVLDAILSKGESSRLYQSLVYDQQVAAEVFTFTEPTQDRGLYAFGAILSEGKTAEEGLAALQAEIARVRQDEVTDAELDEAKNQIISEALEERETAYGRAYALANAAIRYGDPGYADRLLADIQAVDADAIQRVARAWFNEAQSVTIRYLGETEEAYPVNDRIETSSTIQAQRLTIPASEIPIVRPAPDAERIAVPDPAAPVAARIPAAQERVLQNGLRVIAATVRGVPLISADLRIASGSAADPRGLAGAAALTADVLTKGTGTRTATEIAQQIEALGASLSASAGADSSSLQVRTRADRADEAFAIFADVARAPTFAAEEVERQRQQTLDGLQVNLRQPGPLAQMAMARAVFGVGPYGAAASPRSIEAITRETLAAYHGAHWRPDDAVLVITGDVSADDAFALAERYFADWRRPANALPPEPDARVNAPAPRAIIVDLPDSGQAAVAMGLRGVARTDAGYYPALVASTVLGGGYSARLNQEIRIKRGLSYGARASLSGRMAPGPILGFAQTRNDAAAQVVDLMTHEFARLGGEDVPDDELRARKATLIGDFGRDVETSAGLAQQISEFSLYGVPLARLQSYAQDVEAVSPAQVRAAGAQLFNPANADLVVAGDADVFFNDIRTRRPNVERIAVDALNLDSESLR